MSDKRLSIVMMSALLSHGGGRETWLNNVFPKLVTNGEFRHIDVYYVADDSTDVFEKLSVFRHEAINFIETRLPTGPGKLVSLRRIGIFCTQVTRRLLRVPAEGHVVVAVGTFYEAAVVRLVRMLSRRAPMLVVWIRGVLSKEINHRHGKRVKDLICSSERWFMHGADRIISNGQDTKAFYEDVLGRHVEAIPNALDLEKFAQLRQQAFCAERIVIAFIGRLSEEKGLRDFAGAVRQYVATGGSAQLQFDIVGDGPLRELATQLAAECASHVTFRGPLANEAMLAYLGTIDAGVCLTYSKESGGGGVSNGLLELMGARRLVIAWDSPIYKQVLDGEQALYVEEANVAALSAAFAAALSQRPAMVAKIEASGGALQHYSLEHHVSHFIDYVQH